MNDRAIAAIQSHRLCEYIDNQRIRFLADNEAALEMFLSRDTSCEKDSWRAHWGVVHRVSWPPGGPNALTFVVMQKR